MDPKAYLRAARKQAKASGYDPSRLTLATNGIHKLSYRDPDGNENLFGRKGYGDYIIYKHLEKQGEVPKGTAESKRNTYHASHSKIRGKWRSDPFSPNMLSLCINW
jgi:hypothetical protein